jgi:hypothetical protein
MKHLLTTLIIVLSITNILSAQDGPLVAGEGEKKVITSGYGKNPDEALTQALRNAVEEAVGTYMTSTTRIENDELIEDKVLSLSRGFIKDFKKLSEMKVEDETKVTISAIVTEDQIIETLTASGVEVKISGGLMFAQFMDMKQQMEDEANLVASLFKDPPENSPFDLEISYSNPVEKDDKYNIELEVTAKINENYNILLQNLKRILDEIAFDYSDIQFASLEQSRPLSQDEFETNSEYKARVLAIKRIQGNALRGKSTITMSTGYQGSTTNPYIIFENLPKESLYKKQFSNSDYKNILSRYEFWDKRGMSWFFERDGEYLFADLFEKGTSPYIVGIMLSDTELRIYRFLNEESFSVINDYLFRYLYNIDFSISQTLSEKLEGMGNHEIVHTFSFDLQPVHVNLYRDQYPKSILSLKTRGITVYAGTEPEATNAVLQIYSSEAEAFGEYSLPSSWKINTPREFFTIPPATNWRLVLALSRNNEYIPARKVYRSGRYVMETEPYNAYWGKITFLPYIESNQTFATIENINLEITADVLSKLTSIIIAIK